MFQLSHAGRLSDPVFKPPMYVYRAERRDGAIMSIQDIEQTREEFVAAAKRAWKVGADGVDFKQAHSFIGDDFLHPANTRPDRYGGSWENRTRFFRETLARMREEITDTGLPHRLAHHSLRGDAGRVRHRRARGRGGGSLRSPSPSRS